MPRAGKLLLSSVLVNKFRSVEEEFRDWVDAGVMVCGRKSSSDTACRRRTADCPNPQRVNRWWV